MEQICDIRSCTGCMACSQVCHKSAISFNPDGEGFLRPVIDNDLCVDCGSCVRVCPANNKPELHDSLCAYSGWSKDETTRLNSSSGGAFIEIAKLIIARGGVVFGCELDEKLTPRHCYIENECELSRLTGSKYVQSYIGNAYQVAKSFLETDRQALFSGTPCQIAGLRNFLKKNYEKLLTIDIMCHGVPSPMIFTDYLTYQKRRLKLSSIEVAKFRDKAKSWLYFNMLISGTDENGNRQQYVGGYFEDPYIRGFLRDYFLRPCCHVCDYASKMRGGDITLADWWGYNGKLKEDKGYERKGVSLLMVNTPAGQKIVDALNMHLTRRTKQEAWATNVCFSRSFAPSPLREQFWNDYNLLPFDEMVSRYMLAERLNGIAYLRYKMPNSYFIKLLERIKYKLKKLCR